MPRAYSTTRCYIQKIGAIYVATLCILRGRKWCITQYCLYTYRLSEFTTT